MGRFRDAMTRDMLLREFAPSTVDVYLRGARGLVAFYRRPPDGLTREEILAYAEHLRERGLSAATRSVYQAAIRFLYRVTLRLPKVVEGLGNPRIAKRKARVLRGSDVQNLWRGIVDVRHRAIFCLLYGCGLRVSEGCGLLTADIDSARGRILVRDAKRSKDRYVPLSPVILRELRAYYATRRPAPPYLFPGRRVDRPVCTRSFYRHLRVISEQLGFEPHVAPHQLRHAYASHQLERGLDIHLLQLVLGHADPRTTEHYITLTDDVLRRCSSPIERLGARPHRRLT